MPEPYDGYLLELTEGGYKVEANGVVVAEFVEHEADALSLLSEHAGDKPKWRVQQGSGEATPL